MGFTGDSAQQTATRLLHVYSSSTIGNTANEAIYPISLYGLANMGVQVASIADAQISAVTSYLLKTLYFRISQNTTDEATEFNFLVGTATVQGFSLASSTTGTVTSTDIDVVINEGDLISAECDMSASTVGTFTDFVWTVWAI